MSFRDKHSSGYRRNPDSSNLPSKDMYHNFVPNNGTPCLGHILQVAYLTLITINSYTTYHRPFVICCVIRLAVIYYRHPQ